MRRAVMPRIENVDALVKDMSERDRNIVLAIIKKDGSIRATKPQDRVAAYVWRMVVFMVSPKREHHCMPVMADLSLEKEDYAHRTDLYVPRNETASDRDTVMRWDMEPDQRTWRMMHDGARRRAFLKEELDPLADRIVDSIPKSQWAGLHRWGRAFGVI